MTGLLKDISDSAKFLLMLLVYTGYMTWWASGISHDVNQNSNILKGHIIADQMISNQVIVLAETVSSVQKNQEKNNEILISIVEEHARCAEIMRLVVKRLDKMESK